MNVLVKGFQCAEPMTLASHRIAIVAFLDCGLKDMMMSKMPLPLLSILEDIGERHPREFVTIQDHPHLAGAHVSVYLGILPKAIKDFSDFRTSQGFNLLLTVTCSYYWMVMHLSFLLSNTLSTKLAKCVY